ARRGPPDLPRESDRVGRRRPRGEAGLWRATRHPGHRAPAGGHAATGRFPLRVRRVRRARGRVAGGARLAPERHRLRRQARVSALTMGASMTEPAIIRTRGLSKRYGQQYALKDLDLEVVGGEVLGYLGPNGAGKTTTIRLLLGLIAPTAGRATLFGLDAGGQVPEIHRRLAYVPGEASLWPSLTGAETLGLLGRVHGRVDSAYRDELIDRFDFDPSKTVRAYSKGNRQKLSL